MSEPVTDPSQPSIQHVGDSVTTGTIPVIDEDSGRARGRPRSVKRPLSLWLSILGVVCVICGGLAGLVWRAVVPLASYHMNSDSGAWTTERDLAQFFAADAWFVVLGLVFGAALGVVIWRWFAGLGWPVAIIAVLAALVMGLSCWAMGWLIGTGPLGPRLAEAKPGDTLPIELTIRAYSGLLVWPFAATTPVLLLSSLAPDPEDVRQPAAPRPKKDSR